jgi:hypothetical protein
MMLGTTTSSELYLKQSIDFTFFGFLGAFSFGGVEDEIWGENLEENWRNTLMWQSDSCYLSFFLREMFSPPVQAGTSMSVRVLSPHTRAQRGAQQ